MVCVDRYLKGTDLDFVSLDNEKGGREITEYLLELGHHNIGCIFEPYCSSLDERFMGYKLAHEEKSISYQEDLIIWSEKKLEKKKKKGVYSLVESESDFSAIICSNDNVAIGAYNALTEKGYRVPEDVSLVGFSNSPVAKMLPVSLTTYKQDPYQFGEVAAKLLINKINQEGNYQKSVKLEGELIKRDSTAVVNN